MTGGKCYKSGLENWRVQKKKAAISFFKTGDKEFNDPSCQCALGELYLTNRIDNKNHAMAFYYFKKAAAQQEQAKPCYFIGIMYLTGTSELKPNDQEAVHWFNEAGNVDSKYFIKLGKAYIDGSILYPSLFDRQPKAVEVKIDYTKAVYWMSKALQKNNRQACAMVAQIYLDGGYGIEKDYKKSIYWCNMDTGSEKCHDIAADIYSKGGFGILQDIDRAFNICKRYNMHYRGGMIYETQFDPPSFKDAAAMYEKLKVGQPHYPEAIARLGWFYYKGLGVEQDYKRASLLFNSEHCADRLYYTGLCFQKGIDCPISYRFAYDYYQRVSQDEQRYACALQKIGYLLQTGSEGLIKDQQKALDYFKKAATANCHHAYNSLGDAYRYGHGVTIDFEQAFSYYTKAAESQDDCEGQYNLAMLYLEGVGTQVNHLLALQWLTKANQLGNIKAQQWFAAQESQDNDIIATVNPTRKENEMLKKELYNVLQALGTAQEKIAHLTTNIKQLERTLSENQITSYDETVEEALPSYHIH